jgi:hypothetical protein
MFVGRAARSLGSTSRLLNQPFSVDPKFGLKQGLCSHSECHRGHPEGLEVAEMPYSLACKDIIIGHERGACGEQFCRAWELLLPDGAYNAAAANTGTRQTRKA